jgi:O-antigen ligase
MIWILVRFNSLLVAPRIRRRLFQASIIFGLWGLSLFVGRLIGNMSTIKNPELLVAAALTPLVLLILYRLGRYEYGVLALLLTAGLFNLFTLPTGTQSRIVLSLLIGVGLVGVWIFQSLLIDKRIRLKPSLINKPLLAFVVINVIAYGWSNLFRDPLVLSWGSFPIVQLAALVVNILLPILALLVSNKIEESKWLRWLTWVVIGIGAFAIISFEFHLPTAGFVYNGTRGTFVVWAGGLAYALALFNDKLPLWMRGLLLVLLGAWLYRNFIGTTSWLSGWIPLGVTCVAITFMRSKKLFVVASLLGLVYLGMNFDSYWQKIVITNEEEGSGTGRLELWEMSLQHVARHPLFGMGPAGYAVYNMTYHPEDARSTHNNYFDILAQTGVIGFGVFLWLFAALLRTGNRVWRALAGRRNFEEAFASAALAGCIGALVAMMLGDWVLPFAYNQTITGFDNASYTWVFLGGMVSLYHIKRLGAPAEEA